MGILGGILLRKKIAVYKFDISENLITVAVNPERSNMTLIQLWIFYFCKVMHHIKDSEKCKEVLVSSLKLIIEKPFTPQTNCFELLGISKIIKYCRIPIPGDIKFTGVLYKDNKGTHLNTKFPEEIDDTQIIGTVFAMLQYAINRCCFNKENNEILFNAVQNIYEIYSRDKDLNKQARSISSVPEMVYAKAAGIYEENSEIHIEENINGASSWQNIGGTGFFENSNDFLRSKAQELSRLVTDRSMDDCIEYFNSSIDDKIENISGEVILKLYYEFVIAYIHYFDRVALKIKNRREFREFVVNEIVDNIIEKIKVDSASSEYQYIRKALTEHFNSTMVYYESFKKSSIDTTLDSENPFFRNYGKQIISVVNKESSYDNISFCSDLFVRGVKELMNDEFVRRMNV